MLVYRVQLESGEGPYASGIAWDLLQPHQRCENHPAPYHDNIGEGFSGTHRFGFKSLEQLHAWFSSYECDCLRAMGFILATYAVAECHVRFGGKQIAFEYSEAQLVHVTALS